MAHARIDELALAIAAGADSREAAAAALEAVRLAAEAPWAVVHLVEGQRQVGRGTLGPDGALRWSDGPTDPFPGGTTSEIIATGRTVVVPDLSARPAVHPAVLARGVKSSAHAPVRLRGEVVGTLNAEWLEVGAPTPERVAALERLAGPLAVAVGHLRQRAELERRLRAQEALAEAARIVAGARDDVPGADAATGLDATLDALVEQAIRLLQADAAALNLADPATGELIVRRSNPLAVPGAWAARAGARFRPSGLSLAAIRRGGAVFTDDYRNDARVAAAYRPQFAVQATMCVPLIAGGELVGVLYVDWVRAHRTSPEELALAEAFAGHAAVAVRGARRLAETRRARAELEAVFDAAMGSVLVFAPDGRVTHANVRARAWLDYVGVEPPATLERLRERVAVEPANGTSQPWVLAEEALRGIAGEGEFLWRAHDGAPRRVRATAGPVLGADGTVVAAVIAALDVTDLHDAITERAQLDGAIKTIRRVAHDLGNTLALVVGYGEILPRSADPETAHILAAMTDGAIRAAEKLAQLQRIGRFAETDMGGGPMLDLEAATKPRPST
jgi:GAF domain-containing protein